jgi:hypothetical protein
LNFGYVNDEFATFGSLQKVQLWNMKLVNLNCRIGVLRDAKRYEVQV